MLTEIGRPAQSLETDLEAFGSPAEIGTFARPFDPFELFSGSSSTARNCFMTRDRLNVIAVAAPVLAVAIGAYFWLERGKPTVVSPDQASAGAAARDKISALGRLEPKGGVTDVGGTTGERVDQLKVAEGDRVEAGQELALLGSYALRKSEQQLAEIQVREGEARLAADGAYGAAVVSEAEAAIEQLRLAELDEAALRSKVSSLELRVTIATRDYERMEATGSEIIPSQELDHQGLVVEGAKAELEAARSQLEKFERSQPIQKREAQAKLATAKANQQRLLTTVQLESLKKGLVAAEQKLELSIIRAPHAGRVLRIVTSQGESIGQRPILQLGDTNHMYAVAEIYETDVRHVRPNQRATITSDALGTPLSGTVESVGMTVSKNEAVSLDPTASADSRVVRAWIRLDDSAPVSGLVDLQVDVEIDTSGAVRAVQAATRDKGG